MILVTGASGRIGRRIAELLAEQNLPLRLMSRTPDKAPKIKDVRIIKAGYENPAGLTAAFEGIDTAFIVSGHAKPGKRALLHKNAIDAAARARVRHLVYLSFQGASPQSKFPFGRDHFQTEQYLKESGVPFTALRDNLYLDVIPEFFGPEGLLRAPAGEGTAAWVAREDAARTAAAVLSNPGPASAVYNVTGPESLSMAETAARLSALAGRELRYEAESVREGRAWRSKLGAPDWEVDTWLGSYEAVAAGELAPTSDTVFRLTGRQPADINTYFMQNPHLLAPLRL